MEVAKHQEDINEKTRDIDIDGIKFTTSRTDPYGFWHLELEGKRLEGTYTSCLEAEAGAKYIVKLHQEASQPPEKTKKTKSK